MSAEKRTVSSEFREFCAEVRDGFLAWRQRRRPHHDAPRATPANETAGPQADEIVFTPLPPDIDVFAAPGANQHGMAQPPDGKPGSAAIDSVCPITRQTLNPANKLYQCRQCGICYSAEGWEFLLQHAKGQCCGCQGVKTVLPLVSGQRGNGER